jgi:hypothetical protein
MKMRIMAACVVACSVVASAQQEDLRPTLPELARRFAPKPVYQSRTHDLVLESLESVLPRADVIVHGSVETMTTYLSADNRDLYTDYRIRPLRLIREPPPIPAATKPGPTAMPVPIVVTRWGGRMTIEGVQVTQEDADVSAFQIGQQVVLLLAFNKEEQKYRLTSPASGAFAVTESGLKPLIRHVAEDEVFARVRGMTVEQFESEVQRLSR